LAKDHTAGSAVDPGKVWTSRSPDRFAADLEELGFPASRNTVKKLLREELGLSHRRMDKNKAMRESPHRNEQFERMAAWKQYYLSRGWPVISIDTKKKELLGEFDRAGQAWADTRLRSWDHDFPSSSWGKVIPYGVYDLAGNEAFVYLAEGADTGELACDAVRRWWYRLGKWRYDPASPLLLLADCGGSNGYRVPLFRERLFELSGRLGRTLRVCHLPPYCSKYNPIDHRVFCHLSRSISALQLTSIEVVYEAFSSTTTRTGLRVVCEKAAKQYEKGIKASDEFRLKEPTRRDNRLPQYNYKFSPN
jgi:hypothetical protein